MAYTKYDYFFKLILIGESKVGKSCIIKRFIDDSFTEKHINTIRVDFAIKVIQFKEKLIKLQIWDTAGENRFHAIVKNFYKDNDGIILVYNLEDSNSFKNLKNWMKEIKNNNYINSYKILVGNKCDSLDRVITEEEGKKFADYYKMDYIEVSAKNDKNIFELFCRILSNKLKSKDENKMQGEQTLPKTTTEFLNNKNSSFYFIYVIILLVTLIIILLIIFKIT